MTFSSGKIVDSCLKNVYMVVRKITANCALLYTNRFGWVKPALAHSFYTDCIAVFSQAECSKVTDKGIGFLHFSTIPITTTAASFLKLNNNNQ